MEEPNETFDDIEVVYLDELEEIDDIDLNEDAQDEGDYAQAIDLAHLTFSKHPTSVFTGAFSRSGTLAVTGGEDDMGYVWSTETGEVLLECTGHKDSVVEASFNFNDQFVATGDMSGLIQVWDVHNKKLVWCYEGDDMEWLLWHHMANVLIAGCQSGDIYVWQIPQGNCKVLPSHGTSTHSGKILADGKRLLAGYGDGQLRLWDLKSGEMSWQLTANIPLLAITSLDITDDANLCIVAPSAQLFKVADGTQTASYLTADETEVEVVAFNTESGLLATGAISGKLCVWDYKKNNLRHETKFDTSITTIKWGVDDKMFVGCTDGCIYVCDTRSGTLVEVLTGHNANILSLSLTKDCTDLLSTSDDGTAKIFKTKSS
ncbi:hypothetical protein PPYR_06650 [Photinus pyralis]|uniref:Uncharacterized protein n=1 Tax=Photinus pyralis TaxID=7054 RepID=A0A1Y1K936_PHOPY|nr:angio-associated migratory cell protein-like [Photinus pyralis]XP_031339429.1 angio-associated migratory cell protein-like [Photinus pyralis]XP_031344566.1 angio-associated migratory cell protein-like [Photinus pyralis]KAB0797585.1 hypothetical protein PPYR_08578 [Photinus pyralis]KAB0798770.1 hypothetical protein PPYR_06650 [Photinus pyralis]